MKYPRVYLKSAKDKVVHGKHHWIFSGAVMNAPKNLKKGEIVKVYDSSSRFLGYGFYHPQNTIQIRMISFDNGDPLYTIKQNLRNSFRLRMSFFDDSQTNCFRLVNSEGDGLSGLTIDKYDDCLVWQISSAGFDLLRKELLDIILDVSRELKWKIRSIYDRSPRNARKAEGLNDSSGLVWGEEDLQEVLVIENGIKFLVDVVNGQKTGLFLDMREMRILLSEISKGKKVLNCFGYNGGFSLGAAMNNAYTTTVDISKDAIESAKYNFRLNNLDVSKHRFECADVFDFLQCENLSNYDVVIIDPPAFAKKKEDVYNAKRAYEKLNKLVFSKVKSGTIVLTCSCSFHINQDEFMSIIKRAGIQTRRKIRILSKHRMSFDHVLNLYHIENDYLKSFLLWVE
ncbi:class I SAM-dependent rRNA methyltransferase [Candidatus Dojkabacteria bacterium]|uniref:Class I SAM-dependent rRNA methyltransferase n=1 Tax=Candidatus Dojkabacteria bacterium TaxID=2099670 RepID=A0A3M0YZH5_9BACT|nr:MAG: class I SAM-dependent rRNA methyltransferase [Candidatus Dojkabacteria bacterium]